MRKKKSGRPRQLSLWIALLLLGSISQARAQCKTLQECQEAVQILLNLNRVVEDQAAGIARQRDILEVQNTQLRARVDDYAAHIDGIIAAQAMLRADVTSQFDDIRAAQDRRFADLQQAIGKRKPLWHTALEWGVSISTLYLAVRVRGDKNQSTGK